MASATDNRYGQKESSDQNFDYMFKILIIGNSSVGKTSFLFRYADDSFTPAFVSTVGIDFKVKTIYRNDKRIKLQIWVRKQFCEGSDVTHLTLVRQAGYKNSLKNRTWAGNQFFIILQVIWVHIWCLLYNIQQLKTNLHTHKKLLCLGL